MILSSTIRSTVNPSRIYGLQGEEVTVISTNGEVLIVEGIKGRFPYRPDVVQEEPEVKNTPPPRSKLTEKKLEKPATLF